MIRYVAWFALAAVCGTFEFLPAEPASAATVILCRNTATFAEKLAAKEIRRYVYLRCGELLPIAAKADAEADMIALRIDPTLSAEEYQLKTINPAGRMLTISGGSPIAVLYGAYHLSEKLGVRFYLHGDVVPDGKIPLSLPMLDERHKPLFATRGIQPFHDFPEGPDWWNRDDYKAYVTQLAKLRMNFIGLHTYPDGGPNAEPLVWIGLPQDVSPDGTVKFSYNSFWANTLRDGGAWGYAATKTSDFTCGAALLFPNDAYGPDVMQGLMPHPQTPEQCNELFNRTGAQFRDVFSLAHKLGVKTCIGTETPLTVPAAVRAHLKQLGKDPADPAVVRELYDGIFKRIGAICPVDYYWLWTPEGWTWGGNDPAQLAATVRDIRAACDALAATGKPCTLATCGWVLGPQQDRAALDKMLPKECPMSCINRNVGHDPVEAAFANIHGRPTWAIPWMENDPNLVAYQPWAGRMRHDAVDAKRLGCSGLLGIHWRTKALSPNVSALAGAAWDQSWVPADYNTGHVKTPLDQRAMPIGAFYEDFARAHFGNSVAAEAGQILAAVDGAGSRPNPSDWLSGPGDLRTDNTPLEQVKKRFEHVARFGALRGKIVGAGNLERFDYWCNTLKLNALMCEIGSIRGQLAAAVKKINAEKTADGKRQAARETLPIRIALARKWEELMACQIATVSTPGELGTVANLEQHSRVRAGYLTGFDHVLTAAMGQPLPQECAPSREYSGPAKIIVPTVRTSLAKGEALELRMIALDKHPVQSVTLRMRPLGGGQWQEIAARHVARAVYEVALPAASDDFQYQLSAVTADGKTLHWPAAAPAVSQTVVVTDP